MPHVTVEYTDRLDGSHDMQSLCEALYHALAAHPAITHPESLKIRAIPCAFSRLGTRPQTFAHARLDLLTGRDAATKSSLSALILATLDASLPDVGSLSVDVHDLSPAYTKRVL
jgi:5-carboxymethyl-2-hydroxymuconate isomerase